MPNVIRTLSSIKWGCEVVQKDKSVSASAFSLSGHDSLYSLSAKKAVLMVPTLGKNQPICNAQDSITLLADSRVPAFLFADSITCRSRLSLHFLAEAFITISHNVSHCICSMHHVLTCSSMSVVFISISCHPPSDTGSTHVHMAVHNTP
jgi:hypothetical protein